MQQRGDGSGRHACGRQPSVQREQRRLDAEPEEHEQERDVEEIAGLFRHGVADADDVELQRTSVGQHGDDANEGRRRARDGIHEVFDAGHLRLPRALMGDQRQRRQGQQLVEQIHRDEIRGKRHAQRDAEAHGEETEELVAPVEVAHVFEAVQRRQRPQDGHQHGEHAAEAVDAERDVDGGRQVVEHEFHALAARDQGQGEHGRRDHDGQHVIFPGSARAKIQQGQQRPADDRQHDDDEDRDSVHLH